MRVTKTISGLILLTAFGALSVFAQNLDLGFNAVPSKVTVDAPENKGQLIQPDGKIIVWGGLMSADGLAKGFVARLNADGTADNTFSYCGCHFISFGNVALQADGKLLVSGRDGVSKPRVVRLNSDGSVDPTLTTAIPTSSSTIGTANLWKIQSNGKFFVEVEEYEIVIGFVGRFLYRLNADGTQDAGFNKVTVSGFLRTTVTWITDFAIQPDGRFLFTTVTNSPNGQTANLRRYNTDGTADPTWEMPAFNGPFGPGSSIRAHGLALQPDGNIIVGGKFAGVNGVAKVHVVRLQPAGNVDLTFTGPPSFTTGGIPRVLQDGKILITAVTNIGGQYKFYRLNPDGSLDQSFARPASAKDDSRISAEKFSFANADFAPSNSITNVQNRYELDATERIFFFGQSDQPSQRFFRLNPDGSEDASFGPNVAEFGKVYALARQADKKIIVAGEYVQMNGINRNRIARVNLNGTLDPTFDPGTGFNVTPRLLSVQADGKILAAGDFTTYNGVSQPGLARLNSDGSLDASFTPVIGGVRAMVLQPDGKLVVAGWFSAVNGTARTGLARLNPDGSLDPVFNPVIGGPSLNAVILEPDGKITFAGSFNGVNGFIRNSMARLNPDGSLDPTFNIGSFSSIQVTARVSGGKYLVATTVTLSRRNADGSADATFTATSVEAFNSEQTRINSLAFQANGKIMLGGSFYKVNNAIHYNFVRLNANGGLDSTYTPLHDPNGEVRTVIRQPDGKFVIGGDFYAIGVIRPGIARLKTEETGGGPVFDFDGDGRADISVFRPSDGNWFLSQSTDGFAVRNFGTNGDLITPADYDGDGKTDLAIYRNGAWWYINSSTGTLGLKFWGAAGDIPVPSDYDGDGNADFVYYNSAAGQWFRTNSAGAVSNVLFGEAGDIPLVADIDGDGKADPTIFRPSNGVWWYLSSATGIATPVQWGQTGDVPVAGDYDGDGKTDLAVWRPSNGAWYIYNSSNGSVTIFSWGLSEDRPVAADYDGDGKTDIAVYRPSNGVWFIMQSTAGFTGMQYGLSTDKPVPNAFIY